MGKEKVIISVNGNSFIMYKDDWDKMWAWREKKEKEFPKKVKTS